MNKKTLNILAFCIILLIILAVAKNKGEVDNKISENIIVSGNNKTKTKADQYQDVILETVANENIKSFQAVAKTFQKNSGDNLTDTLSKDVFTQYIKYNSSGEIKEQDVLKVTQDILKNKDDVKNTVVYSDLKTIPSTVVSIKTYGNTIGTLQNKVYQDIYAIRNKKNTSTYIANIYNNLANTLIETPVPDVLFDNHLLMINSLKKYSEGLKMMEKQKEDPALALLGLNKVKDATDGISKVFVKIQNTINASNIKYEKTDPGYFWIQN